MLHEIIHVLFPDYTEDEVDAKTYAWLRRAVWVEPYTEFELKTKADFEKR